MSEYTFNIGTLFLVGLVWVLLPAIASLSLQILAFIIVFVEDFLSSGSEVQEETQVVQERVFKREPSRWDWNEYRRHRHEEAFVEASMWLSMGDD